MVDQEVNDMSRWISKFVDTTTIASYLNELEGEYQVEAVHLLTDGYEKHPEEYGHTILVVAKVSRRDDFINLFGAEAALGIYKMRSPEADGVMGEVIDSRNVEPAEIEND
jgi:hypothetical protein